MARPLVLDTNFWMLPARSKKDVLGLLEAEGFSFIALDVVLKELEKLSIGRSVSAGAAKVALQLIKRKGLKSTLSSGGYADEAILAYCQTQHVAAATQDLGLRRELRRHGIPVVTLNRSGKVQTEA